MRKMPLKLLRLYLVAILFYSSASCSTTNNKFEAVDTELLVKKPIPANYLSKDEYGSYLVNPELGWLSDLQNAIQRVCLCGLREYFGLVLSIDTTNDIITILPLGINDTPLDILSDDDKKTNYRIKLKTYHSGQDTLETHSYAISELISENKIGSPLPDPTHIFAVAAQPKTHANVERF